MSERDDEFEQRLSTRLQRVEAPATLADAVMQRAATEPRGFLVFRRSSVWTGRVAALLLLTALLSGLGLRHQRSSERARAERDFARSLDLTSRALEPVRQHLRRAGVPLDE